MGDRIEVRHQDVASLDDQEVISTRFQTVAFGGTAMDGDEVQDTLREAGLAQVATLPTPEGAPGITIGRRLVAPR